jgi:hypothetical protein
MKFMLNYVAVLTIFSLSSLDVLQSSRQERCSLTENLNSQNQLAANNQEAELPTAKRARSDVWRYFTKIHVKDPDGKFKQAYGMCNFCHSLLKAPSSNGTNTLRSHTATCRSKQLQEQTQ